MNLHKLFFAASLSLALIGCTKPSQIQNEIPMDNNPGVFGGKEVHDDTFNGVVGLVMLEPGTRKAIGVCTGTLISETIVLTAAHCVTGHPYQYRLGVSFDKNILSEESLDRLVLAEDAVFHDRYSTSAEKETYDLGLVKIRRNALPAGVKPVKLATSADGLRKGTKITVAGYGVNSAFRSTGSGTLRTNKLKIDKLNYSRFEFSVNQLANGVCSGDSGGPAYIKNQKGELVQVGVVSRGFDLLVVKCIIETYFTRVDQFQDWIKEESARLNRFDF